MYSYVHLGSLREIYTKIKSDLFKKLYKITQILLYQILWWGCGWDLAELWMWSSWLSDLAEWLERLAAITNVTTILGSIPASSDTVESEGQQLKQCWITYIKKPFSDFQKNVFPFTYTKSYWSRVCGWDLAVLWIRSVESERRQLKQCWITYIKKSF